LTALRPARPTPGWSSSSRIRAIWLESRGPQMRPSGLRSPAPVRPRTRTRRVDVRRPRQLKTASSRWGARSRSAAAGSKRSLGEKRESRQRRTAPAAALRPILSARAACASPAASHGAPLSAPDYRSSSRCARDCVSTRPSASMTAVPAVARAREVGQLAPRRRPAGIERATLHLTCARYQLSVGRGPAASTCPVCAQKVSGRSPRAAGGSAR
jgi:hypothetical protein